ncbi:cytosol non-specific dipeptidase [Anaeramoeba flamelloides]|uniref:Cytosol non-specific dipeptidase n=1 Tax=Anaeramoeba flamelloides TaxID=1746091 RepID=A0AAV7YTS8_9EUKA|nr:cytosol non-specific dipeptidase [Anaeramoeba flamelloides]|eukprot:Anaeramoba_flamelloidesa325222_9263.p1 GENE.a325222_9263~~a325222_9263.p1  ORF type:complete len:499 (+),score=137.71 a325222_9263:32-1528(+)
MEVTNETNKKVLKQMTNPKKVWELFLALCEIPRASGNMKGIREALLGHAKKLNFEAKTDEIGNVLIKIPATKGKEKKPSVCLQGHMDMVATKDENLEFDFATDPITTKIDGEWLTAEGTTLGADNGIGIALGLALLEEDFKHGPLELLFTVDEETTMEGAFKVDQNGFINSKYMINIDSEEDGTICFGSAGGFERNLRLPLNEIEKIPEGMKRVDLYLHELLGGHTGVQIHENRANAIKWVSRLLLGVENIDYLLATFTGGHAKNAIPSSAKASILVPEESVKDFKESINATHKLIMKEFEVVETKGVILELTEPEEEVEKVYDRKTTLKFFQFLLAIPHGVIRMSPDVEGLVESSQSVSIAKIVDDVLDVLIFARSSSLSQMQLLKEKMRAIARLSGADYVEPEGSDFPPWQPQLRNNLLLDIMKKSYTQVYKKEPHCYAIHAGLECSIIQSFYQGMTPLSIGPTIINPHTTQESLQISTVSTTYDALKKTLELIAK